MRVPPDRWRAIVDAHEPCPWCDGGRKMVLGLYCTPCGDTGRRRGGAVVQTYIGTEDTYGEALDLAYAAVNYWPYMSNPRVERVERPVPI